MGIRSAIKEVAKDHIHHDVIANEPLIIDSSLDGVDPVDREDLEEYSEVKVPLARKPWMRTVLMLVESVLAWFLLTLPSWLLSLFKDHQRYNIVHFKVGDPGFIPNAPQEFWRWSVYIASSYVAFLFAGWAVSMITVVALAVCRALKVGVTVEGRRALKMVKRTQTYIASFLWILLLLFLGTLLLYTPELLKQDTDIRLNTYLRKESTERILLAASFITALFAFEKYIIQVITHQFHRESLSSRIATNNEKRQIVGKLYRASRISGDEAARFRLQSEFTQVGINELHYDDLLRDKSSESIASKLYKAIAATPDAPAFKSQDLKRFLQSDSDAKRAFRLFDPELRGSISLEYFKATVKAVYEERDRLLEAIVENGRVIRRFDNALMIVVAILSIIGGLSLYHAKGYTLVVSLFSIFLTLAFLVKDTMSRLSDAFRLIYIQRAFDVGDVVVVDGTGFTVTRIRLFTSTFVKNSDKSIVYIPNHVLAGKVITNTKRLPLTVDKATLSVQGNIPMSSLGSFRDSLKSFTENTFPEFSGNCVLKIKETENIVEVSVDLSFQPTTDEKVLSRRSLFKAKVTELLENLRISVAEPKF